jgi:hypothetical protein
MEVSRVDDSFRPTPQHDLFDHMGSVTRQLAEDYARIRKNAAADAGTAGDAGEESWAQFLRNWLPRSYYVTTKGRILAADGREGPQVDVVVFYPWYPEALCRAKKHFAAGVAAAFECKLTLKREHIFAAAENAAAVRRLLPTRTGTPRRDLNSTLYFGLLAHSHAWTGAASAPRENVERHLADADQQHARWPRETLDAVCVPDLGCWYGFRVGMATFSDTQTHAQLNALREWPYAKTGFCRGGQGFDPETLDAATDLTLYRPPAVLLVSILEHLAWQDPGLRDWWMYWNLTCAAGGSCIDSRLSRVWQTDAFSSETWEAADRRKRQLLPDQLASRFEPRRDAIWDEWAGIDWLPQRQSGT